MSYTAPSYGVDWRHVGSINTVTSAPYLSTGSSYFNPQPVPAADMAVYMPVLVKRLVVVRRLFAAVSGVAGNVDIGIYSASGVRVVSTGLTAAASSMAVDITDTTIAPGFYYLAFLGSTVSTLSIVSMTTAAPIPAAYGVLVEQMGAGGVLPASASWAVSATLPVRFYVVAAITNTVVT
jgi:hypothetical protein